MVTFRHDLYAARATPDSDADRSNCAVMAVTVASGAAYKTVQGRFQRFGRRRHAPTCAETIGRVAESYGAREWQYPVPVSIRHFLARAGRAGRWIILTYGHAFATIDGEAHDLYEFPACRVYRAWQFPETHN